MTIAAEEEAGNLVRLNVQGQMTTADQAALMYFVTKAVEQHGRIRLLITLAGFEGWTAGDDWGDDALRIQSDEAIVKAAVVGDARWKDDVFAFVAKPFRTIPIEYFTSEAAARAWLDR